MPETSLPFENVYKKGHLPAPSFPLSAINIKAHDLLSVYILISPILSKDHSFTRSTWDSGLLERSRPRLSNRKLLGKLLAKPEMQLLTMLSWKLSSILSLLSTIGLQLIPLDILPRMTLLFNPITPAPLLTIPTKHMRIPMDMLLALAVLVSQARKSSQLISTVLIIPSLVRYPRLFFATSQADQLIVSDRCANTNCLLFYCLVSFIHLFIILGNCEDKKIIGRILKVKM